jgi:hypothetical protein
MLADGIDACTPNVNERRMQIKFLIKNFIRSATSVFFKFGSAHRVSCSTSLENINALSFDKVFPKTLNTYNNASQTRTQRAERCCWHQYICHRFHLCHISNNALLCCYNQLKTKGLIFSRHLLGEIHIYIAIALTFVTLFCPHFGLDKEGLYFLFFHF